MVVEAVRSVQGRQVEKEAIAMFIYAMVNMEVVYGAEASGGQYRSRLLEGEYGAPIQTMVIIVRMAITENRFVY
ncbi:uncharacterized protein K444DRAFT_607833 [Hyaloscypha bicolor E]|uniref:Uncharacterized protein n=1 Tax=Hyaloscypha bicolor E TaxID=1095630 RepID=A0A2J6TQN6_9HELO|nr:uncharacterized protein K444DRAFT_607833 [Hyaloscypha bicolor E]PMD65268.1 hypothetical protein K444DRAFT_607833 [Hyaloscypha bicolor E]